jgi:mevalonate kinase
VETLEATLPTRKGLSSSAAACVLVARCFGAAYGLELDVKDEMELAYRGEAVHTPSKCGAMDQACAYGSERVVALAFDGEDVDVRACEVGGEIHIVVCDLAASKNTVRILADLQGAFDEDEALRSALGARNRALVAEGLDAIKRGDARALGAVYTRAQSTFDEVAIRICPSELTAPRLRETLAAVARDVPETVFGAKGVGSQGDGAAQFVAVSEAAAKTLRQYLHDFSGGRFKVFDVVLRDEERRARTSPRK